LAKNLNYYLNNPSLRHSTLIYGGQEERKQEGFQVAGWRKLLQGDSEVFILANEILFKFSYH
jgi:hypothetical protein